MVEWFSSRRDSPIVARHEVPGIIQKIAPSRGTVEGLKSLSVRNGAKIRNVWDILRVG
jgi:hypothetical protein